MKLYKREKKTHIQIQQEDKLERIKRIYDDKKVKQVLAVEKTWNKYALLRLEEGEDAFHIIFNDYLIGWLIQTNLNKFENAWKNKRIYRDDFESVFWEKLWHVCREHSWNDEYYLYEKIRKSLECSGYNLVKAKLTTDKRRANHQNVDLMADLEKMDSPFRIENDIEIKLLINQYCNDIEADLITTYIESPHLSYRDLGRLYGINHPERVRRILDSAKRKLREIMHI
ncbi:sigma-70 family RNA polymerase sigma factor [Bacillus cereus]|uniref:sigma-70 family RNA polymerase sigma factor n=1 Tax=Bacillus cereus group TaxID=86661 RepID=UPI00240675F0|nr:sigma-70 family RNA polymerase sigma factor [Bacillus cereus]MDA2210238.1 sigma-70 family RNA polymerase sigma factor [Bacillus cereus]MDA2221140.1 sigma-70 family RNA polymerase sigma factor [Bacillus cereus]MDF9475500.1 sigma-70 family RNA polymerase sigma factor [Bacillus cereus]MDF9497772.1 sigma-70 family RNA polymerase sigma factor [Bacillus cereus]MDF9518260.1 sigma-70 family RNA polymerase sigma factor [Bacillus cereus]